MTVIPVEYEVSNQREPGSSSYTLRGFRYEPKGKEGYKGSPTPATNQVTHDVVDWLLARPDAMPAAG